MEFNGCTDWTGGGEGLSEIEKSANQMEKHETYKAGGEREKGDKGRYMFSRLVW